ncbi:MAG TPA: hypothetical protein VF930_05860 [Stellaceae bacterium]
MLHIGTRQLQTTRQTHAATRSSNLGYGLDPGMSKRVTASITFVDSATNQLQAANNTFTPFAVGDNIRVDGANLNNTIEAVVTAIDATNHAFLTLADVGVKNEGPITCTVRAI